MISIARHGRLQRISRLAIFFTGMSALVIGGIMSISSFHQEQQNAQININQNLKTQAQILVDQFYSVVETLKNNGTNLTQLPYVTYKGTLKVENGAIVEIESLEYVQKSASVINTDMALDERLLAAIKKQISVNDLHFGQASIGTYDLTDVGSKEGIFFVTPIVVSEVATAISPNADGSMIKNVEAAPVVKGEAKIEKLSIVLIDPVKAIASLSKLATTNSTSNGVGQQAFLMGSAGKILAHTSAAYVGTDMKKIETLKESIEALFLGAQTGIVTHYRAIDGDRQQIAFVRAGAFPFAIGVEQKSISPVMTVAWISDQLSSGAARKNFGLILILFACALVMMSAVSIWFNSEIQKTIRSTETVNASTTANKARFNKIEETEEEADAWVLPKRSGQIENNFAASTKTVFIPAASPQLMASKSSNLASNLTSNFESIENALVNPNTSLNQNTMSFELEDTDAARAADQFVESHTQLSDELRNSENQAQSLSIASITNPKTGITEFVNRVSSAYTIEGIERELVDACSKVTESPTLYFRYHKRNQNLVLAAAAGAVQIQNHSIMQVYVRKDIEQQIENFSNEGKVASVSNYGPMAKLMIANLNVAHFEAWAVTSDRSVNLNGSQLLGVLVVLQAGFKSAESRPILGKMIREAGNYLFAQNGKIRSNLNNRATHDQTTTQGYSPIL